jgi:hypothetical protein
MPLTFGVLQRIGQRLILLGQLRGAFVFQACYCRHLFLDLAMGRVVLITHLDLAPIAGVVSTGMSTEANIEIVNVKKAYADFGRGDIASILAVLADDALWITPSEGIPTEGTRHGKAEVTLAF